MKFIIKPPAKINIGLRVLSKRKDNFHNLETIFYPIRLFDIISGEIKKSGEAKIFIQTDAKDNLDGKNNICYKSIISFFREFEIENHFEIRLSIKKNIPIAAGLGGGSSDAAGVLKFLAKYFKKENENVKLKALALKLGSDVPFFLLNKPTYATGRGEIMNPIPRFRINDYILLAYPGIYISTADAFGKLKLKTRKQKILQRIKNFSQSNFGLFINDFEEVIFKTHPIIKDIKGIISSSGSIFTSMSGSGSVVYGIFPNKKSALETKTKLKTLSNFIKIIK